MNHNFQFRVWDVKNNSYKHTGNWFLDTDGNLWHKEGELFEQVKPDEFHVECCLGLKDRDGTLIFANDVLERIKYAKIYLYDKDTDPKYNRRKQAGAIVEERENKRWNELAYYYKSGDTDVASAEDFPVFLLEGEDVGWEGEGFELPESWLIVGNIHERKEDEMSTDTIVE